MNSRIRSIKLVTGALIIGGWLGVATDAFAVPILFNLRDTTATVEIESGIITRSGVTTTLTALIGGSVGGTLNQNAGGFGINAPSPDVIDQLDGGNGIESISIIFDQDVLLTSLQLSIFSAGERASLTINGFPLLTLSDTGVGNDVYGFAINNKVEAGETVILSYVSGNGFSFDSFTVDTAVPETMPFAFTAAILLGFLALSRYRAFRLRLVFFPQPRVVK